MPHAEDNTLNQVIGQSLLVAETVAAELRERLAEAILAADTILRPFDVIEAAREILQEYEPILAETLSDAEIWASVAGWEEVVSRLPADALREIEDKTPPRDPPRGVFGDEDDQEPMVRLPLIERARDDLLERGVVTRADFDEMAQDARQHAFTIARIDSEETISAIREALAETVREGASLRGFESRVIETLETSPIGAAHLENVYRTNIQSAFHAAHEQLANEPVVRDVFPYQAYHAIHDGRVRDEHLALELLGLDGTNIYRRDDPMWSLFLPPWDFQCRCGVTLLTKERAAALGVTEAQRWVETGVPPDFPEHRLDDIPFRPDSGFVGPQRRAVVTI